MSLNYRRIRILSIAALVLSALALTVFVGLAQDKQQMVMLIDVQGNKNVPTDEILSAVKATQIGAPLNLDAVRTDQAAIANLGYFSEVQTPEITNTLGGVKVTFHVVEYPPLKEIRITGLTKMPVDKALAVFATKPGQPINRNTMSTDLRALMEKAQNDYGLILTSPKQNISPDGVIDISLVEMRLRNLTCTGLEKTKEQVVLREITAKRGEIFDTKVFRQDLQNLFMLGYFESINPKIIYDTGVSDMIDIQLDCKERKTATITAGLSYSTKDGELAGLLKYADTNFFGTGNSLGANLEINPNKHNIDLSYNIPWLDTHHTSLNLHAYYDYDNSTPLTNALDEELVGTETMKGFEAGLGRPIGRYFTAWVTGKYQLLDRYDTGAWTGGDFPENASKVTPGEISTDSISLKLEYKHLTPQDSKYVYVADGIQASLDTEFAGGFLGGDTEYQRYQLQGAFFKSVSPRDVLALRLTGGYVNPTYDPFETANFILGGAETIRGYDYSAFSTTQMVMGNAEYRHRFGDSVEAVAFYDQGWFDQTGTWDSAAGYGLGVRVQVPYLGQLRLDYGWPTSGSSSGKFYFSIGETF